ncbi:MAG: chorismate mutase [Clostridium sp.]|uniref:chorismate mutase n=1 Tax=Clostridium sp. TaxID=1506 RepID=UPI00302CD821
MNKLEECRKEIDEIDSEIIRLFEKRMDIAIRVANYKKENEIPIYNSGRESEIINKSVDRLNNKEYELVTRRFFLNLMELSRSIQESVVKSNK